MANKIGGSGFWEKNILNVSVNRKCRHCNVYLLKFILYIQSNIRDDSMGVKTVAVGWVLTDYSDGL